MGLMRRMFTREKKSDSGDFETIWRALFARSTKSGATVSAKTALELSAVLACVRVIAEDIGKLPLKLYQSYDPTNENKRRVARDHPLYALLTRRPNGYMTAQQFIESMTACAALGRDAFAIITRGTRNQVLELIPVLPDLVTVKQNDNYALTYKIRMLNGTTQEFAAKDIFHLKGVCLDGHITGTELFCKAREAIGLALTSEELQAVLHGKGATPSGLLTTEQPITPAQAAEFAKFWKERYSGSNNAGETPILYNGFKYQQLGLSSRDAQLIETRKFQILEICRIFRVHPNKIFGADGSATYASAAQFAVDHVGDTVQPWAQRWEQAVEFHLLSGDEYSEGYYAHMPLQALMRGDSDMRVRYYKGMREIAAITPNEVRALEELDPIDNPKFDDPMAPLNTNPLPGGAASPDPQAGGKNA